MAHTDAQAVWKELSDHMRISSKGASEKRRLTQYVTNTVLDDNFKGTTEQFVLHFNEQFRQLEEISEDDERLPHTVKLTLLQTAVNSSGQIEWFKNSVDDRSVQVGGKQRICTIEGYSMPLTCRGGLMYLSILGQPTDKDLERYPAVHLTGPNEWDPSVLDYTHPSGDGEPPWSNDPNERIAFDPNFDEFGDYTQRAIQTLNILDDSSSTSTPCPTFMANQHEFRTYQHAVNHEAPDYEKFRPYFGWVNVDTVQKTMERSAQWGVSLPNTFPMRKHLKSRNPALNIPRRHEAVATDTVFSDTPAVDSGVKQPQVFVARDTLVADAYPMKSGKQFVNTLENNIRRQGAMDKLLSDSVKTEISNKVMDILRAYHISNWHSEPYHQNQNPAEWRYRTIKSWTSTVMNRSGAPANCWL